MLLIAIVFVVQCTAEEEERIVYPDELPPDPFTKENVEKLRTELEYYQVWSAHYKNINDSCIIE